VTDARIAINPPDLGPIDIYITVHDDQARIHFAVQHDAVRDAVQDSLPRLRDMLLQSGLQLANADVSTGRQDHPRAAPDFAMAYTNLDEPGAPAESTPKAETHFRAGFVDTYI
jgi:flagellar hook-length control protein FliK